MMDVFSETIAPPDDDDFILEDAPRPPIPHLRKSLKKSVFNLLPQSQVLVEREEKKEIFQEPEAEVFQVEVRPAPKPQEEPTHVAETLRIKKFVNPLINNAKGNPLAGKKLFSSNPPKQKWDKKAEDFLEEVSDDSVTEEEEEDQPLNRAVLIPFKKSKDKGGKIKINIQNPSFRPKENSEKKGNEQKETLASNIDSTPDITGAPLDRSEELRRLYEQKFVKETDSSINYIRVFEVSQAQKGKHIHCRVCDTWINSEISLLIHARGKRHTANIESKLESNKIKDNVMKVAPGEPVPPGFEDEMCRVPTCQALLDQYDESPLIGLEYLVEILPEDGSNETGPQMCLLCDEAGSELSNLIHHLIGTTHRLNYLRKHYPTAHKEIENILKNREHKAEVGRIVRTVSANIQNKYGRLPASSVDRESFRNNLSGILKKIDLDIHFSEKPDETFLEVVKLPEKSTQENNKKGSDNLATCYDKAGGSKDGSEGDIVEILMHKKKKQVLDDPLRGTTPISRSSSSLSLSSSSKSRSQSPTYVHRRLGLYGSYRVLSSSLSHRSRSPRHRRRSRSPRNRRSPSIRYRRSRSPRLRRTRSPRPHRSPKSRRSRSPRERKRSLTPKHSPNARPSSSLRSCSPVESSSAPWLRGGRSKGLMRSDHSKRNERPLTKFDKWAKFREEADAIDLELKEQKQFYKDNLEKHPLYAEEWKKFWTKRYKQIQTSGGDPTKHNYKPEWIEYWNAKIEDLHDTEFKTRKDGLKKKFELSDEDEPAFKQRPNMYKQSQMRGRPSSSCVGDVKDTWNAYTGGEINEPRGRSPSPWEGSSKRRHGEEPLSKGYISRSGRLSANVQYDHNSRHKDDSLTVVSLLRLLSALEDQLGSLGPKINTCLAQAISLEKASKGSSESLMTDSSNVSLFEMVKEKLKGQLLAGIVEKQSVAPSRMAINDIGALLAQLPSPVVPIAPMKKFPHAIGISNIIPAQPSTSTASVPPVQPVAVPGVGVVEREAVAKQIAEALLAQGKHDVSNEELEQLINAVMGMAQQSVETNTHVTTATFVKQMEQSKNTSAEVANTETESGNALQALQAAYRLSPKDESDTLQVDENQDGHMSENELKTLLQSFKTLTKKEQQMLVGYLRRLESKDMSMVNRLRKYVNLSNPNEGSSRRQKFSDGPISPFSSRQGGANPSLEDPKGKIDDSDEEYSYEDVINAAARNLKAKQPENVVAKTKSNTKKSVDSHATKETIEATTDNMMASLVGSISARKDNFGSKPTEVPTSLQSSSGNGIIHTQTRTVSPDGIANSFFASHRALRQPNSVTSVNTAGGSKRPSMQAASRTLHPNQVALKSTQVVNPSLPTDQHHVMGYFNQSQMQANSVQPSALQQTNAMNRNVMQGNFSNANLGIQPNMMLSQQGHTASGYPGGAPQMPQGAVNQGYQGEAQYNMYPEQGQYSGQQYMYTEQMGMQYPNSYAVPYQEQYQQQQQQQQYQQQQQPNEYPPAMYTASYAKRQRVQQGLDHQQRN